MSDKPLVIYGVPFSVHTRKVILSAKLKSIRYELTPVVPVVPDSPPPNWRTLSPTGLIPAVDHDGYVLADSTAIVGYLDRVHPEPALLPAEAKQLGRALFLDAWAGTALFRNVVHPLFLHRVVLPNIRKQPGDVATIDAATGVAAPEAFAYLEGLAPDRFLVGGRLSIADLAVVSNLITLAYLGLRVDAARHPALAAYLRRHLESPLLSAAVAAERPFVERVEGLSADLAW